MRYLATAVLLVLFAVPAVGAEEGPDPYLTAEERLELIQMLEQSRDKLMGLITGLSDEQWSFKQNDSRWSVGECAEHIVRSEASLLDLAKQAMSNPRDPEWVKRTEGKNQLIRQVMPNRQPMGRGGATAPMEIRPSEKWSRAKTIAEFYKIRGEVRAYVETIEGSVKDHTSEHPFPVFNWLSAYDWLIYVPTHTIRHSRQIVEVQEAENYPAN